MTLYTDYPARYEPLLHAAAPPRRGRPPGSRAQVVRDTRSLGIHHFAFVRSSLLGLDLRYIQNRRNALLKHIIEAGRHLDATLPASSKITHLLDLLRSDTPVKAAVTLPSLQDWVEREGMDPDAWSEAELVAEYKAAFGLDNIEAIEAAEGLKDPAQERVRALNHLDNLLSIAPTAADRLEAWFAKPVVKCLRTVGILTLGDLVRFINVYGYRWHARIQGFGVQRAQQVLA